jgi:hypothetical protein
MTVRSRRRTLLAGGSAALGVLVGGFLGVNAGLWLSSQVSDAPASDNLIAQGLEVLVEVTPYAWAGALIGALLGWLVAPFLVGIATKWPKIWLALGVQIVVGVAAWVAVAFIATVADVGIGALLLVGVVILGPPAVGRWFVEHKNPRAIPTDDVPLFGPDSRQ